MYLVNIDHDKCNSCGECVEVCPEDVIEPTDFYPIVFDEEGCVGCESCAEVCEQEAIIINEVEEPLGYFFDNYQPNS